MLGKFTQQLTCGAMTKIVIKVKRMKLIHTNERKNTKKEPIPAPKCPKEKIKYWVLLTQLSLWLRAIRSVLTKQRKTESRTSIISKHRAWFIRHVALVSDFSHGEYRLTFQPNWRALSLLLVLQSDFEAIDILQPRLSYRTCGWMTFSNSLV